MLVAIGIYAAMHRLYIIRCYSTSTIWPAVCVSVRIIQCLCMCESAGGRV